MRDHTERLAPPREPLCVRPGTPIITLASVSKRFRSNELFHDVSLEIGAGSVYALVGPNGSGKSILLRMLCGFALPTTGTVFIAPEFLDHRREYPDRFGAMIDGPGYLPGNSAEANLLALARIRNRIGRDEVHQIMERLRLPRGRVPARRLSTGMKQKIGIAQAVMERPDVLILDEPFNALDATSAAIVHDLLLAEKARGTTIVLTSHRREDLDALADIELRIDDRRVVQTQLTDAPTSDD